MKWVQRTLGCTSVQDAVQQLSGEELESLVCPQSCQTEEIENMIEAADVLRMAATRNKKVVGIGDFDCDGITATAILENLFRRMGLRYKTIIPRRMSEGYGVSECHISDVHDSVIVTVDNGVSAGHILDDTDNEVVVLDHHLPSGNTPTKGVVVDPYLHPEKNGFVHYCGAGLAYKLYCSIYPGSVPAGIIVLAGIGTLADRVPLIGENRRIVWLALGCLHSRFEELPMFLRNLFMTIGKAPSEITAEDIVYKIVPMLNAPGRLYDDGGSSVLSALLVDKLNLCEDYLSWMSNANMLRKEKVKKALQEIGPLEIGGISVVYSPFISLGLTGVLASKLVDAYNKPVIVLADSPRKGLLKGSMRTAGGVHARDILESASDLLDTFGGHSGAAGLSIREENVSEFKKRMESTVLESRENILYYDVVVEPWHVRSSLFQLKRFAPYGAGVPEPVICVEKAAVHGCIYMGADKSHVKLLCDDFNIVAFGKAAQYRELGEPTVVDVVGTLGENTYNRVTTVQLVADDFRPSCSGDTRA